MKSFLEHITLPFFFMIFVLIFWWGEANNIYLSRITIPILAVFIIGFFKRIQTLLFLIPLNGIHFNYNRSLERQEDRKCIVEFSFCNLFRLQQRLSIYQKSTKGGNWESKFYIKEFNPISLIGFYEYTKSGSGKKNIERKGKRGNWGTHELDLHPSKNYIHVTATGEFSNNEDKFILIKETEDLNKANLWLEKLQIAIDEVNLEKLKMIKLPERIEWENLPYALRMRRDKLLVERCILINDDCTKKERDEFCFKATDHIHIVQFREKNPELASKLLQIKQKLV